MSKLPKHVQNYFDAFGYDRSSFIACEICGLQAVEVHHIEPRSSFGSKRKEEQDNVSNLAALCRDCHNNAHGELSRWYKAELIEKVKLRALKKI